jgi:hypothetical protein
MTKPIPAVPKKIAFVAESFSVGSPAQQLLDRFLIGYTETNGVFRPTPVSQVSFFGTGGSEIDRRVKDFGLKVGSSVVEVIRDTHGTVVVAGEKLVEEVLRAAPPEKAVFAYGAAGISVLLPLARQRQIYFSAGSVAEVLPPLPALQLPNEAELREALIVVQGKFPDAEMDALYGIFPYLERRKGGESSVIKSQFLKGQRVWQAGDSGQWSWELLAAALSRTDKPQGHALVDGRTEDMVGLRLVQKMATDPRAWLLEHRDGLRTTILVLDGVVGDTLVALHPARGRILSTQLFRSPSPQEEHYSRLVPVIMQRLTRGTNNRSPRFEEVARLIDSFTPQIATKG